MPDECTTRGVLDHRGLNSRLNGRVATSNRYAGVVVWVEAQSAAFTLVNSLRNRCS
ncbi:hypothetical protein NEOLEDRAFT_1142434 [Neolentinus lepideus HHB14362 ss-1]|uniref:Uncharacterized protein n=1 Tax=Neolentinus lepideus HHB14362 ss-1 TaxID=1314782 RepID=A0A165N4D2_9AGAM|nr:hypothetical protein NEOLEDRAFT_1142434 [Neolentinus lepideus HHB14362 ss-1]